MTAARVALARARRARRRWRPMRLAWIPAAAAVVLWATSVIDVNLVTFQLSRGPAQLQVEPLSSPMVRTPEILLRGRTDPNATITTFLDGARLGFSVPDGLTGDFGVRIAIPDLGIHRIRIEAAYKSPGVVDELAELSIVRVPPVLPGPQVIGVEALPDPTAFMVVVRATPRTSLHAEGGTIRGNARVPESGRATIEVQLAEVGQSVTLTAEDIERTVSEPTGPLDLRSLADARSAPADIERATWAVSYLVTRKTVIRTQTVTLDKGRAEVADLTHGEIDARTFVFEVAGPAGVAPVGNFGCLVSSLGSVQSQLEVGDRAVVTLTDEFPDLLASWNGLSGDPKLSLCFPWGFPGIGNAGSVEMKVQDYEVLGVTGAVDSVTRTVLDSGVVERTYRWERVPRDGRLDVRLSLDAASALAALPTLRPREFLPDEGIGPVLLGVVDALIHAAGVLLLLWAVCSRAAKRTSAGPNGVQVPIVPEVSRTALADILTISAALLFLAPFAALDGIGVWVANGSSVIRDVAVALQVAPSLLGRWIVTMTVVFVATVAGVGFRTMRLEFLSRTSVVVGVGAGAWLTISVLGAISAAAIVEFTSDDLDADHAVRIATWLIGAAGLTVLIAVLSHRFGAFLGRRNRVAVLHSGWHRLGWALVLGLALAVPAGTEQDIRTSMPRIVAYIESTASALAGLVAFALPLVAITAVAAMIRAAWLTTPWERTMPVDSGGLPLGNGGLSRAVHIGWLGPQLGRALVAGFVVGTAGVFLPVPFVLALLLFGLLLRPAREAVDLVRGAPALRAERRWVIGSWLGDERAATRLDLVGRSSTVNPTELAPESSVWGNVRLALSGAIAIGVPLVFVYLSQYPFASMTQQDEYYLQRLIFNIATFTGTWLTIAVAFAILFEYLRGASGVRKGLWFGFSILAVTVPWQLVSGLATTLSPVAIGIHVFEVVTFTGLLGAIFDVKLIGEFGKVRLDHPRELLANLGVVSGLPDLAASLGLLLTAIATTIASLLTGQVTQLLTRVLSPFLPVPTN